MSRCRRWMAVQTDWILPENHTGRKGASLRRRAAVFEIGYDQGEAVQRLMEQAGYREVECVQDFAGLDRVVFGTLW